MPRKNDGECEAGGFSRLGDLRKCDDRETMQRDISSCHEENIRPVKGGFASYSRPGYAEPDPPMADAGLSFDDVLGGTASHCALTELGSKKISQAPSYVAPPP
jgi:hypothetical protein